MFLKTDLLDVGFGKKNGKPKKPDLRYKTNFLAVETNNDESALT